MPLIHRNGKWRPVGRQSHAGFRVGDSVLAVLPPHDDREVCTIRAFHKRDDGVMRVSVADDDGVLCWIDAEMIERKA